MVKRVQDRLRGEECYSLMNDGKWYKFAYIDEFVYIYDTSEGYNTYVRSNRNSLNRMRAKMNKPSLAQRILKWLKTP